MWYKYTPFLKFIACQAKLFMHKTYLGIEHEITHVILLTASFVTEARNCW